MNQPKCPHCGETESYQGANSLWKCGTEHDDSEQGKLCITRQRDRILAEVERLKKEVNKPRCEFCGSHQIIPDGCARCGAPQCCDMCCQITTLEYQLTAARQEIEALQKERDEAREAGWTSVTRIWLDCLGNKTYPKAHLIDALGKTTRRLVEDRNKAESEDDSIRSKLAAKIEECEKLELAIGYWKGESMFKSAEDRARWQANETHRLNEKCYRLEKELVQASDLDSVRREENKRKEKELSRLRHQRAEQVALVKKLRDAISYGIDRRISLMEAGRSRYLDWSEIDPLLEQISNALAAHKERTTK